MPEAVPMHRRSPIAIAMLLAAGVAVPAPASAETPVHVLRGSDPGITAAFPNDRFTVTDPRQVTGRRVHLTVPRCTAATSSTCDTVRLLDRLDGFDIQPRVSIPFSGPIDIGTVGPQTVWVEGPGLRAGLIEVVLDP